METTIKTSVSIEKSLWKLISKYKNKSGVINKALAIFFDKEQFLKKAEDLYWENVKESLKNKTGEYIMLNEKGKKLKKEDIRKKLWI